MRNKLLLPIFILLFCLTIMLAGCGGGGTESSSAPDGINTGIPSVVKLLPVQFIAQTNSFITLRARVLDGNGAAVPNYPVSFTNLSLTGVLSAVTANTNNSGNAEVRIFSTTPGFATIVAQVTGGSGQVRDIRTVYFTSASSLNLFPTMALEADGDNNGIFDETSDFILFENPSDTDVLVKAIVRNSIDQLVSGISVTFGTDIPYKVGADPAAECSDGTTTCSVSFPLGRTATTDSNGEAFVLVRAIPAVLSSLTTRLNITAQADNGAFNMLGLFLQPVTVQPIIVSAAPTTVASGGTTTISAAVSSSLGTPVPDGTTVNFTVSGGGGVEPFGQTTNGVATAKYTAPVLDAGDPNLVVTVTASVGAQSGSTTVTVTAPVVTPVALSVLPAAATVADAGAGTYTGLVSGGTTPYAVLSSNNPAVVALGDITLNPLTGSISITPSGTVAANTTVLIIIVDNSSPVQNVTITLTVTP